MDNASTMIRVGVVSSTNSTQRKARVIFPALDNLVSDWLFVLQQGSWMPSVNDRVLVLYLPGFNTDGFILGEIK